MTGTDHPRPGAGTAAPTKLTMAQLRAIAQPPAVMGRRNSEHWAGALYLRKGSIYLTRLLLPTGISANGVTGVFIAMGIAGSAVLVWPSFWAVVICAVIMQLQMMVDCSDGEVARVRRTTSPKGVYLDRLGHYVTEALLPLGVGVHVDGGLGSLGGWTTLGAVTGIVVLLGKMVGDLIHIARAYAKLPLLSEDAETAAVKVSALRTLRNLLTAAPFFRAFISIEFSLIIVLLAVIDEIAGGHHALRIWTIVMLPLAVVIAVGRLTAVLLSSRLSAA